MLMTERLSRDTVEICSIPHISAAIFDFNGTITADDCLQYGVYAEIFADEAGIDLDREFFFTELSGRCDLDIITAVFARYGSGWPSSGVIERIGTLRVLRYLDAIRSACPVRAKAAELIRELHRIIPLAVVTGAPRGEVEPVLYSSGLLELFNTVVACEDVTSGKPSPEGFLLALERMRVTQATLSAQDVVVFEDSPLGILAAKRAGMRCVGVHLKSREEGRGADVIADELDTSLLRTTALRR